LPLLCGFQVSTNPPVLLFSYFVVPEAVIKPLSARNVTRGATSATRLPVSAPFQILDKLDVIANMSKDQTKNDSLMF
jgi:hypothetical protein